MYSFDRRLFGFELSLSGKVSVRELSSWLDAAPALLTSVPQSFGLLVDMLHVAPLDPPCLCLLGEGMRLLQRRGLRRMSVIVANTCLRRDLTARAKVSGADRWERYFCVEEDPDWREHSFRWLCDGSGDR